MKRKGLEQEIQLLIEKFESVVDLLPSKTSGPILKQLELLQKHIKPRKSTKGSFFKNQNSGLLKPVEVSKEMAVFANWSVDELHSRVDVTKAICNYIKIHDLQKPSNKKTILPDAVLTSLLKWDSEKDKIEIKIVAKQVKPESTENSIVYTIHKQPENTFKKIEYYNGSELYNEKGHFIANIKNCKHSYDLENVPVYFSILHNVQSTIEVGDVLTVDVVLTYPKIQTRISLHLKENEKVPKVPKQKRVTEKKVDLESEDAL